MPAARYWRVVGISTYGGGDLELSDIALYSGGTRVDGSATFTSTFAPISAGRWAAADVRQPGFALQWDFGAAQDVDELRITAANRPEFPWLASVQCFESVSWSVVADANRIDYPGSGSVKRVFLNRDVLLPSVLLLAHMDGVNGGTTFVDSSPTPKAMTASFGATTSTTQSRFGGSSAFFPAVNGPVIQTASADFSFGTGQFCVELWFYPTIATQPASAELIRVPSFSAGFQIGPDSQGTGLRAVTWSATIASGTMPPVDQWTHIALCRGVDNVVRMFYNGIQVSQVTTSTAVGDVNVCRIGNGESSVNVPCVRGYIDEVRITRGFARYSTNFTPPDEPFSHLPSHEPPSAQQFIVRQSAPPTRISEYTPPATVTSQIAPAPNRIDIAYGGTATVAGTVKKVPNVPLRRRVRLYDENGRQFIREVWSDAVTGEFVFTELNPAYAYTVVTYDYENNYRALTVDKVVAV